ncbi:MAG: hypothetical protein IT243_06595 [Bacteroidia bacterium]|nr:hypothetical protein [Bacteroidia bacterium]
MQINWVKNDKIDFERWDNVILNCEWGNIYSLGKYIQLITNNNWEALIIGEYEYIMPVPIKKKYGLEFTYRPDFCQQLGVFSISNKINDDILSKFIKKLNSRFKFYVYNLNYRNNLNNYKNIKVSQKTNFTINLNNNYEFIYSNYNKELKRNLKKAEKNNLEITNNISLNQLISNYKNAWQSRYSISDTTYNNFKIICEWCIKNDLAKLYSVKKNNIILSSCIIFLFKNRIYYPFSSIISEGKKNNSTEFMIDFIIKKHSNTNYVFDFEGSDIHSVQSFYRKFSPQNEPYFQISKRVYFLECFINFRNFLKNVLFIRK